MRQQTPRFRTSGALAAGGIEVIRDLARFFRIVDITGATSCAMAFGEESATTVDEGMAFMLPESRRFDRITIINNNLVPITVRYAVSDDPISDDRASTYSAILLSIDGRLNNIDADTTAIDASVQAVTAELQTGAIATDTGAIATDTAVIAAELQGDQAFETVGPEITPAATTATIVLASNADRKGCVVQAKSTNTDPVYIGFDNTVTDTRWVVELQPGQGYTWDNYRGDIWSYAVPANQDIGYGEW